MLANAVISPHELSVQDERIKLYSPWRQFWKYYEFESYSELGVIEHLISNLRDSDVYYDIGAHIGLHSCFAAKRASKVIAFEPHLGNRRYLQKNLQYNADDYLIFDVALSDKVGDMRFTDTGGTGYTKNYLTHDTVKSSVTVSTTTLDSLADEGLPIPDVIKIDVQGAEYEVLKGMEELLNSYSVRGLYVEVHLPRSGRSSIKDFDGDEEKIIEFISEMDFQIEILDKRKFEYHLYCQR